MKIEELQEEIDSFALTKKMDEAILLEANIGNLSDFEDTDSGLKILLRVESIKDVEGNKCGQKTDLNKVFINVGF